MSRKQSKSESRREGRSQSSGKITGGLAARGATKSPRPSNLQWPVLFAAGAIVLATVAAYSNSFHGPFVFDDTSTIIGNKTIEGLWPIWKPLCPPSGGETVSGRPLLNLTLAINYAISGYDVRSYHAINLLIHVLAALLLFGVVRRTFCLPSIRDRWAAFAVPLAFIIALLWAVHPLLTESVTYIIQRAESLVGLFYLLTLYCVIRGVTRAGDTAASRGSTQLNGRVLRVACPPVFSALLDKPAVAPNAEDEAESLTLPPHPSPLPAGEGTMWYVAAVLACLAGMASKEIMVSAPLIMLLYDRAFLAGSFREAWRQRKLLYIALAATWILLVWLVIHTGNRGGTAGFGEGVTVDWWTYLCTQFGAIVHYLRLAVWPHPLVFHYGVSTAHGFWAIVPYAVVVALLAAATVIALWRWPKIGFLGAWFFAILAPTSSVVPVATQTIAEHRMYLPLVAVVVGVVCVGYFAGRRLVERGDLLPQTARGLAVVVTGVVVVVLASLTFRRNVEYSSELSIWQATAAAAPYNAHAFNNVGMVLAIRGRFEEAKVQFRKALEIDPRLVGARYNLGAASDDTGQRDEAIACYRKVLDIDPNHDHALNNLGMDLVANGQVAEGIACHEKAVKIKPRDAKSHFYLANAYYAGRRFREARDEYQTAVELKPDFVDALRCLASLLATCPEASVRDGAKAVETAERALSLSGDQTPDMLDILAAAYAEAGQFRKAVQAGRQALRLAAQRNDPTLVKSIKARLSLYEAGMPYHETTRPPKETPTLP